MIPTNGRISAIPGTISEGIKSMERKNIKPILLNCKIMGKAHWFNVISRVSNAYSYFSVLIAIQLLATKKLGITVLNKIESIKENSQANKLMQKVMI